MNRLFAATLSFFLLLGAMPVQAAPTRFTSPSYGVESIIFGGTGTLRDAEASIPPVITAGPTISNIKTTSVDVSWTTDKASNSVVALGTTSGTYTSQAGDLVDTTFTSHTVTLNNLVRGTQYFYKVRSSDVAGNLVESSEKTFTTDPGDITPPVITTGPSIAKNSASLITVTWETNELSSSVVEYGINDVTENGVGRADDLTLFHQVQVSGLQSSQKYLIRVKSRDAAGNNGVSETQTLETLESPSITEVRITDITLNSALLQWRTTTPSTSVVNYGKSSTYTENSSDTSTYTTTHLVRLSGLESGTTYYLRISGTDQAGNRLSSDEYIFKTVVLPLITDFSIGDTTANSVNLNWKSSSDIDEFIRYEIVKSDDPKLIGKKYTSGNDTLASNHVFQLTDLDSETTYSVTVLGKDVFGNQAVSPQQTFTTLPDRDPPVIKNIRTDSTVDLGSKQTVQALVLFDLSEPGKSYIEYGPGASGDYDKKVETDSDFTQSKFLIIPGLKPGNSYHFHIVAVDRSGNQAVSDDVLFLSPAQKTNLIEAITHQLQDKLGWIANL